MEISGGLTEKLWHGFSTLRFSKSDSFIEPTKEFLRDASINSRKVALDELSNLDNVKNIIIQVNNKKSIEGAVNIFNNLLNTAKYEIKLLDPYMQNKFGDENLHYYLKHLCKLLRKDISIKIITCGHDVQELKKSKSYFSSQGYDIDIISYDLLPNRPIHRRLVLIDKQSSIHLDKGLRFLYEYDRYGNTNTETNIVIHSNKNILNEDVNVFERFWNYNENIDTKIKNWPKCDTRELL